MNKTYTMAFYSMWVVFENEMTKERKTFHLGVKDEHDWRSIDHIGSWVNTLEIVEIGKHYTRGPPEGCDAFC
jgi:hypothetical protein